MTKVVVTGGAGFIGSHIVQYWSEQNADVHVLDNLRSGYKKNIEHFPNVTLHEASITDRAAVDRVLDGADYVHHLAAMISVPESMERPQECVEINVNGLLNVLESARSNGIKKVVHSSSAAIYGENPESPKRIDMRPEPISPYGITKLDGEYYLDMYHKAHGLETVSLRYFNVFGPRQDPKSQYAAAIPIFVSKALKNEPLVIFGDGEQTRDFVFVKDVRQANILAATQPGVTGVFNVANGHSITIKELAELIVETTGSTSEIRFEAPRPGDIKHSLAAITESREKLNFNPQYDLIAGLKQTIEYFMEVFGSKQ